MAALPGNVTLTDAQWRIITDEYDYSDFSVWDFADIKLTLLEAHGELCFRTDALKLPALDELALWDTSDDDAEDLLVTVRVSDDLALTTSPIPVKKFRADVPDGPAAARYVIEQLLAHRNQLVSALATALATATAPAWPASAAPPLPVPIVDGELVCPYCNARDDIIEIDSDVRRNPVHAMGPDTVDVHQQSQNYSTDRFECGACGREVAMPHEVTY